MPYARAVTHFPGLAPFDSLRTYATSGGHITTTWFATAAAPEEVAAWYGQRLPGYEQRAAGDWTKVEVADGVRRFHGVTVHAPGAPAAGPRPTRPPPPDTGTVVRDDAGTFPAAPPAPPPMQSPPVPPPARPSLLRRVRGWFGTPR